MNNIESKVYFETKLRNLKRKQAKLAQDASLTDEYFETGNKIKFIENVLASLQ